MPEMPERVKTSGPFFLPGTHAEKLKRGGLVSGAAAGICGLDQPSIQECTSMSDTPPDRLSINPKSPYFNAAVLERGVGIRFRGVERNDVDEYCVSEGWIRVPVGNTRDRHGYPLTIKLTGPVEPYFEDAEKQGE